MKTLLLLLLPLLSFSQDLVYEYDVNNLSREQILQAAEEWASDMHPYVTSNSVTVKCEDQTMWMIATGKFFYSMKIEADDNYMAVMFYNFAYQKAGAEKQDFNSGTFMLRKSAMKSVTPICVRRLEDWRGFLDRW